MAFNTGPDMLDSLVLSTVAKEPTYGYRITQETRPIVQVSESSLYPVLRRLQRDGYLETYDQAYAGRNRRYYRITEAGQQALEGYRSQWIEYREKINRVLLGEGEKDEQ